MMMLVPPISIAPKVLTADAPGVSSAAVCGVRAERQRVEQLAVDHALLPDAARVDGRRRAADRDRLADSAHPQLRVHRGRGRADDVDALAPHAW